MALIKKYSTGGSFEDYVNKKLIEGGLTNKSYQYVQDALNTFDPNTTYEEGKVRKNWAGQDIADNPELANIYLANLHKEYQNSAPKQVAITPKEGWGPIDRSIGTLMGFIAKNDYSGNEDYALKQIARMTDNKQVKKYVANKAKNLLEDYVSKAEQNPNDNWKDLENIRNIKNVLTSINTDTDVSDEDWEKLTSFTDKLGWQVNDFLIPDETLEERKQQSEAQKSEQSRKSALDLLKNIGVTDENKQAELYQSGYRKLADNLHPTVANYLTQKGYNILSDESGRNYKVLKGNELVTGESGLLTEDQFSEDYGKYFTVQNGNIIINDVPKDQLPEGLTLPKWRDEGNIGKGLRTDDPNFANYDITGYSRDDFQNNYDRDVFGRRDYTGQLTFTNKLTGKRFNVTRGEDGKYYKDDGTEFAIPKITGFTNAKSNPIRNIGREYFQNPKSVFYNVKPRNDNYTLQAIESELENFENAEKQFRATGKVDVDNKRLRKLLENSAYLLQNYSATNLPQLDRVAQRLQALYNARKNPNDKNSSFIFNFKQGGILKAQNGLTFAEMAAAGGRTRGGNKNNKEKDGVVRDVSSALKNSSTLQKLSLASSVLSFIPGVGVIGGLGSTGLDLAEGLKNGWDRDDTKNLLSNLGFTALSAVGLGATKGLKIGTQAAKLAKTAKAVDTASDVAKAADIANDAVKAANKIKKFKNLGSTGDDLLKVTKNVEKAAKAGKAINPEELKIVNNILKSKTTWLGSQGEIIGDIAKSTGKFLGSKAPIVGKVAKVGLEGQAGYYGLTGAADIVKNISQEEGDLLERIGKGIRNTDINALRNVTQLGSLAVIGRGNYKRSRAAKNNFIMEGVTPKSTKVIVEGKSITVPEEHLKKYSKSWKGNFKSDIKQKDRKKFLEDLKNKVSEDDKAIIDDILKGKVGKIDFKFSKASGGTPVLANQPRSYSYKDLKDYERARKMAEGENYSYADPRRLLKVFSKKQGGILKFQNSGILPTLGVSKKLELPKWLQNPIKLDYNTSSTNTDTNNLFSNFGKYMNNTISGNDGTFATKYPNIADYLKSGYSPTTKSSSSNSTGGSTEYIEDFQIQPFNPKKYRNLYPFIETAKLGLTNAGNARSTALQIQAASELPTFTTAGRTSLRTSNMYSNLANKQAGDLRGLSNRIASSISDLDQNLAIRLAANKQASDIISEGQYRDIESNRDIANKQLDLDISRDTYNRDIMNQTSQLAANARKSTYLLGANEVATRTGGLNSYLSNLSYYNQTSPYRKAMWEYQQESMNPNITEGYRYENYLNTTVKDKFKKQYEEQYKDVGDYGNKPKWEESAQYKEWQRLVNEHRNTLNNILSRSMTLGRAVQSTTPAMAEGGRMPLNERIVLENVKFSHRKLLKRDELFYKQLLENNKLVQKALIKVFK